jgi:hypothetical protein
MNLNGMSGDYYDYLRASSSSIIVGATWNKIVHVCGKFAQALSAGSVDYSTAAAVHYLDLRLLRVLSWFCIPKQVWETVNRLIILGYKSFPDPITECLGIIMRLFQMLMLSC